MNKKIEKANFYVLGDSLSDTGALVSGGTTLFKHLKIKKVIKMLPPFYANCFSNGKVAIQIVAAYFSITLHPAWKFDLFGLEDEQVGNNYAVGGALASRTRDFTINSFLMNHFDLAHQVHSLKSQHNIHEKDIIFITIGGNDIFYAIKKSELDAQMEVINNAIAAIKTAIENLIASGARTIILTNVPDVSTVPFFKNNEKDKTLAWNLTSKFNEALLIMTKNLDSKNEIIINFDLFNCMRLAMQQFQQLDSNNNIIDGATTTDFSQMINNGFITPHFNKGVNYENINNYFFFDDIHPNQWAHNFIAQQLIILIKEKIKFS